MDTLTHQRRHIHFLPNLRGETDKRDYAYMIDWLIQFVLSNLNYWYVFIFMAVESSFIPFPSEAVVPPAAFLAMTPDNEMNILLVVLVATAGANVGALANYYLAKWLGRPVIYSFADSKIGHMLLITKEGVEKSEEYFRKHGVTATFFGRLIPAIRQLISIPAGLANMKMSSFLTYTSLGALLWNSVLATLGYVIFLGADKAGIKTTADVMEKATSYSHEIGYAIIALVVVALLVILLKNRKKKHAPTD